MRLSWSDQAPVDISFGPEEQVLTNLEDLAYLAGYNHLDRQRRVWYEIHRQLDKDSAGVGMLLLYSPEEADALDESVVE